MTVALGLLLAAAMPMDFAVDQTGRTFEVAQTPSSVELRVAEPGESFGPWRTLLRTRPAQRPVRAAVAADGRGVIAYQSGVSRRRRVRVTGFDARGRVSRPRVVSRGRRSDLAALAVARGGAAVVVWFRHRPDGRWRLEAAVRDPGAAGFGPPRAVSPVQRVPCCTAVAAAIGDRGDAVLTWRSTLRPAVWAALRAAGERFRPPQRLAPESSDVPRAAIGANGAAAVIYSSQHVPLRPGDGLRLHRASSGGAFGAAEIVNPGGGVTLGNVTVTRAGRTAVAWIEPTTRGFVCPRPDQGCRSPPAPCWERTSPRGRRWWPPMTTGAPWSPGPHARRPDGPSTNASWPLRALTSTAAFGSPVALGAPWPVAAPRAVRLTPGGGALVLWTGTGRRRSAHTLTRLR